MLRNAASKVAWVGRTASMVLGLALVLALVLGVASAAMGANGNPFLLGKKNVATAVSTLVRKGPGPALKVVVGANQPPLTVNASAGKAKNLNSDKVDGLEGASFVQGGGQASQGKEAIPSGSTTTILTTSNPSIQVSYECPTNTNNSGYIGLSSPGSTEDLNVVVDSASFNVSSIDHYVIGPGGFTGVNLPSTATGSHFTIQAQGANVATIEMFSFHRAFDCHTQAQALVTR